MCETSLKPDGRSLVLENTFGNVFIVIWAPLPAYQTKIIIYELSIWSLISMMNHLNPFGSVTTP